MTIQDIINGILNKDIKSLARAISWIEKEKEEGVELIKNIYPNQREDTHIIGITGFAGVGKSTLSSRIIEKYRSMGKTVGVIAIDPSSPFTGGALLGDRLRLGSLNLGSSMWTDSGVFYRSVSNRGRMGGLSRMTGDIIAIMNVFGFDKIIIETVGAGQSEVDVIKVADTSVVVLMPGMGDRVQFAKAGILEIADIFVVNKSDLIGADRVRQFLEEMLNFTDYRKGGKRDGVNDEWKIPIVMTIGEYNNLKGIDELVQKIDEHFEYLVRTGRLNDVRRKRAKSEIETLVSDIVIRLCYKNHSEDLEEYAKKVADKEIDQYTAAEKIVEKTMSESDILNTSHYM